MKRVLIFFICLGLFVLAGCVGMDDFDDDGDDNGEWLSEPLDEEDAERLSAARKLHKAGKLAEAREALRALAEDFPENAETVNELGEVLLDLKELSGAEYYFKEACRLDPQSGRYEYNLGRVYLARPDLKAAIKAFARAASLDGKSAEYQYALGEAFGLKGYKPEALRAYHGAILRDKDFEPALRRLAYTARKDARYHEAYGYFKRLLKLDSNDEQVYLRIGECLFKMGQYKRSFEFLKNFPEFFPNAGPENLKRVKKFVDWMREEFKDFSLPEDVYNLPGLPPVQPPVPEKDKPGKR
jgi:predicted Zn-dependent protease